MKWVWWIGGAFAYLVIKNEVGIDSVGMWIIVIAVLLAASLLGESAEAKAKKNAQAERDRLAAEAANTALDEFRQRSSSDKPLGKSSK